jgi:pimeloyl-ACP methyl ester carboxylesterase
MSFLRLRLFAVFVTFMTILHMSEARAAAPAVQTIDQRITVRTSGAGPDVILIPGLASSAHVWDRTVANLTAHYRVHVVQVAGFAGTPPLANASGPVFEPLVAAVHDYIAANHLKEPAIIGHSLGGLVGMTLAIEHPADVGRLMIVDSLPFFGMLMGPDATVASVAPMAKAMRAKISGGTQQSYAAAEPAVMKTLVKSTGPEAQAATAAAAASDKDVVGQAMLDDMSTDVRPDLAKITQKVTMLYPWDAASGTPQAVFDGLYTGAFAPLKQAHVQRIDGSFHFIMIDQPAAFQAAVEAFLKG